MKIPVPNGGGSGSGSTECTATAEDVLETKTAIYNGSGDEPDYGSMKNVDSIDPAKSITIASGVLYARMTRGAHVQNASSGYPEVSVPQADLASVAGLTAAKIATGNTILGIAGTYKGVGTAGTSQVLSGYTFSSASLSGASGAMSDRSGTTTSATASLDSSNSRVRMQIPNTGYYNTSAYLYSSYSSMASLIGLTAAKIASGNTILGIAGTAQVFTYINSIASISASSTSTETWREDDGVNYTFRSFTLQNLGFTPRIAWLICDQSATLCQLSGCHVFAGSNTTPTGYYTQDDNSNYIFTESQIHVPLYFTSSSNTCWYMVAGYY